MLEFFLQSRAMVGKGLDMINLKIGVFLVHQEKKVEGFSLIKGLIK